MSITIPAGLTRDELLECVDREIKRRDTLYPRWVQERRLPQESANRELLLMRAIRDVIEQLPGEPEKQGSLFGEGRR